MTSRFIPSGAALVLPSGTRAVFRGWRTRVVNPEVCDKADRIMERVAVVQVDGEQLQFSERFIALVRVIPEAS